MRVAPLSELLDRLEVIQSSRGPTGLINFCKSVRSNLLNYLSGNPERDPSTACTKDGIPRCLGALIPLVREGSNLHIALILTILMSTRSLKIQSEPDIVSIIQPWEGDVTNLTMFMGSFWRDIGYKPLTSKVPKSLLPNFSTYRSKAGPNGHALSTSIEDARCLPDTLINSLEIMGGPKLGYILKKVFSCEPFLDFLSKYFSTKKGSCFRRLSYFPDKEGKMRVVGILDWWSQITLKPLHIYLSKVLAKIPQDCTLDQAKFLKSLKGSRYYHSVDLSAATDRFPIALIKVLLKTQLPSHYVDAWEDVMVGYPFKFKAEYVKYSVGNPMGAYSSFNSFALTHHYLIYYCCRVLGKNWKTLPYALLGDDIVIGDDEVGKLYKKVILSLGLKYSPLKTHSSERFFEFAKRYFYKGQEITPFPYSALKECGKSYSLLTTLLFEQEKKGLWLPISGIPSSVEAYYSIVRTTSRSFRRKIEERSWLCEGVLKMVSGVVMVSDFLDEITKHYCFHIPKISDEIANMIFQSCLLETFSATRIAKDYEIGSVGSSLVDIPLRRLSAKVTFEWHNWKMANHASLSPQHRSITCYEVPQIQAWKAVDKEYRDLLGDLERRFIEGEDWLYKFRVFSLPGTDKSILDKGNYILSKKASTFGDKLVDALKDISDYNTDDSSSVEVEMDTEPSDISSEDDIKFDFDISTFKSPYNWHP